MRKLICLAVAGMLAVSGCAAAEETGDAAYDGPAWTFGVPLAEIDDDYLLLANSVSPLTKDYEPDDLRNLIARRDDDDGNNLTGGMYLASGGVKMLRKAALNALGQLLSGAEDEGVILFVRTAYRSYAEQEKLYSRAEQRGETKDVQKPGECDYQTGLAVMLVGREQRGGALEESFAATAEGQWLQKNAARYGFIFRYPEGKQDVTGYAWEPWHLRYVGIGVAEYIQQNNLTLEEFVQEKEAAFTAFGEAGGDVEAAIASVRLPKGAVELEEQGPDGDREIILFHD